MTTSTRRARSPRLESLEDRTVPALVAAYGFNEGAGTTLPDLSANGNTGTIAGAGWIDAGRFGKALSFDGVNDRVNIPDAASLDLTTGMTLEAWVYPTALNSWESVLLKEANGDLAYALYADNNGEPNNGPHAPGTWVRQGTTTSQALGSAPLPLDTWTHLAATYDGTLLQMYVNGEPAGSVARTGPLNATGRPLRIGGNSVWSEWFNGRIDEVRVYNHALTAVEIREDMETPVVPDATPPTVVGTFPAAGATGVSTSGDVTITFSEGMAAGTINGTTIELRDASNAVVPATVVYQDASPDTATVTPSVMLNIASTYSVVVRGGPAGVSDRSGNRLAADYTLAFTTAPVVQPPPDNVFGQFAGSVASATAATSVPIRVAAGDFAITHGAEEPQGVHAVFGFVVHPTPGSPLVPRGVSITNTTPGVTDPTEGVHVLKTRTRLPDGSSLVLVELGYGDYAVGVRGLDGTTGGFTLTTLLVGDVNGDFRVTAADLALLSAYKAGQNTNPAVLAAGDADRNGRIRDYDLTLAGWNVGNETAVRVLGVTTGLDPAADTGVLGDQLVNTPSALVSGLARPGAQVALDQDGDGFDDGTTTAGPTGAYSLPAALVEGPNPIRVRARDGFGQEAIAATTIALDTQLTPPAFDLSTGSDTGPVGDQTTTAGIVSLVGQTDPGQTVTLHQGGAVVGTSLASGTGTFQFAGVELAAGDNAFVARTIDAAGNVREFTRTLTRVAPDPNQQDVALRWNQATLNAIRLDATAPPMAARALALVSTAIFDAVSAIEGTPGYLVKLTPPAGASAEAAAATAAYQVLAYLYPGQLAPLDAVLAASLAQVPAGPARDAGVAFGRSVGDAVVALRAEDGARDFTDHVPPDQNPGTWQPTPPMYAEALLPQFATVEPFALTSPDQFRPAAAPALGSAEYTAALAEVQAKGRAAGSTRTADETQAALFWADGSGTVTPPGHWNRIAMELAAARGNSLSANARLFAQLNVALADAGIASWDAKYAYGLWRPVTAIRAAGADWTPLLVTPNFPTYTSGHSTFSGAAQVILESAFGPAVGFTTGTEAPGVPARTFTSFRQAAEEAGQSRIYGGIHFQFDNQAGLAAGRSVANHVLQAFSVTADTRAPAVNVETPDADVVTPTNVTVAGQVLDNLSGVQSLEVQVDDGAFVPVPVGPSGTFAVPTAFLLNGTAEGAHSLHFRATDFAGNESVTTYTFTLDTLAPTIDLAAPQPAAALDAAGRLTGVASGTGSAVTALSYAFDGGPSFSVVFDLTTGAFDQALDLSALSAGGHTLTVTATDAAGLTTTTTVAVTLAAAIPLTVTEVTPAAGATDVGTTLNPRVAFSRPVNKTTLSADNFYATDTTGERLTSHIVVADDGTAAWLFFDAPMPGASTVTVTVDGSTILAADGSLLDAAGTGVPGSTLAYSFTTVGLTGLAGTSVTGILADPGPDLRPNSIDDVRRGPDGELMTWDDVYLNPIAGARVYILGMEDQGVYTDADGRFTLPSVPTGSVKFVLDGQTATNAPAGCYFPEMVMDLRIEPGKVNTVMGSMGSREQAAAGEMIQGVYLPRLKSAILQPVSNTEPTLITVPADAAPDLTAVQRALLTAEVQPGTAIGANGEVLTDVQLGISTVPPELIREMLPPGVSEPPFTITVQAPGVVTFTTPVAVSYPNVDNLPPGTKTLFISFNHATGLMEIDGTATVSADGTMVVTDPDSGITHPGWHFVQVGTNAEGQPALENQVAVQVNDGLLGDVIEVDLSGTNGREFQLHSNSSAGRIAEIDNWQEVLRDTGKFYFIPNFDPISEARFTQAPVTAEYTFSGIGRLESDPEDAPERRLFFTVQIKEIRPGYSGDGDNRIKMESGKLNTYRIEQRLRWLGFRGEKATQFGASPTVTVDADLSPTADAQAVKLFKAVIQIDGRGNPASENGTIGADEIAWLNAANAPIWDDARNDGLTLDQQINAEYWATSWTRDILIAAGANAFGQPLRITSLTEYPDIDWNGPAQGGPHSRHKAGHDIDIGISDLGSIQTGTGTIDTRLPFDLYQTAISDDERAVALRILAIVQAAGTERIEAVFIGGTNGEPEYPRIHTILTGLGVPNHSTSRGHDDHIHITVKPPGIEAATSGSFAPFGLTGGSISNVPGFGTDAAFYYRIDVARGISVTGRATATGGFSAVLAPNALYTATFYQASTNRSAVYTGQTNGSGQTTQFGTIILDQFGGVDADADGIPDDGEVAIGTNPNEIDSDADGISDSAELEQGLDPLDGRSFPTGVIASLPLQGTPERVAVEGDRIYVATGDYGLAIIDGTRFDRPVVLGQLDLPGYATSVAVDAGLQIAAVAGGDGGGGGGGEDTIYLVDVSDPTAPRLRQAVHVDATRIEVADGIAYATAGTTLYAVDMVSGTVLQSLDLPGFGEVTGLAREGTFLYAFVSGSDTLSVIDIADEGAAFVRGQVDVDVASGDVGLFVGNGIAWLAGSGLRSLDVSDPDNPQVIQTPTGEEFFNARRMALNGSGLGLLTPDGGNFLQVYDTSDPNNVADLLLQLNLSGDARDVVVSRGVAYLATSSGLEVVNYLPFDNAGTAPAVTATTAAVDQDPAAPGVQVLEGTTLPVRAAVADDVQVRTAEVLVNGEVVRTDVSFPFDFFVVAPAIATVGSSFTVQVRATDTGGNVGLSNVLTVDLVADTFAPVITGFVPPTNSSVPEPVQVVQVRFNEPMAEATVTSAGVRVRDAAGNVLSPTTFQLRDDDRLAQLTFPALLVGNYQIEVNGAVTDRAGNALGADVVSPFTLTPRASLETAVLDADPGTPGVQVYEGTNVPLTVSVVPGVDVQTVELLVDGAVVATAVEAPYEFTVVAPNIAPGASSITLQARVTDTSGLVTLTTPPLAIGLLEDVTAPTVVTTNPADGGTAFSGLAAIDVAFSEGMAAGTFDSTNFSLVEAGPGGVFGDGNDVVVPISGVAPVADDTVARLSVPALAPGAYQLQVAEAGATDRAGNAVGADFYTSAFTVEEYVANPDFYPFGTRLSLFGDDQSIQVSNLPFPFEYFGQPVNGAMFVTTNGVVEFDTNTVFGTFSNFGLPNGNRLMAAPFFDDLYPPSGGRIGLFDAAGVRAITWENLPYFRNTGVRATFQIAFLATGVVEVRYGSVAPMPDGSATIGLTRDGAAAVPSLGRIANRPDLEITDESGFLGSAGLNALNELPGNDVLVFRPNGSGNYDILLNPTTGQPQFFAGPALEDSAAPVIDTAELHPAIDQAVRDLAVAGYNTGLLTDVRFHLVDLPGSLLGWTVGTDVWIDPTAAGYGWYTGAPDAAFATATGANEWTAAPDSPAYNLVDLVTVVTHELGHVLGFDSIDPAVRDRDWMTATLGTGVRRTPNPVAADFPGGPADNPDRVRIEATSGLVKTVAGDRTDRSGAAPRPLRIGESLTGLTPVSSPTSPGPLPGRLDGFLARFEQFDEGAIGRNRPTAGDRFVRVKPDVWKVDGQDAEVPETSLVGAAAVDHLLDGSDPIAGAAEF